MAAVAQEKRGRFEEGESKDSISSSLFAAVTSRSLEAVTELLVSGCPPDTTRANGETPLILAAKMAASDIISALIVAGADPNRADNDGATPLFFAAAEKCTQCVKLLLAAGAQVDIVSKDGMSPLMCAAEAGSTDVLAELLRAGAFVDRADWTGRTALIFAVTNDHVETARMLLRADASANKANAFGMTPLMFAASNGNADSVRVLLSFGANVHLASEEGKIPAHFAANMEIAMMLYVFHSNFSKRDQYGHNVWHYVSEGPLQEGLGLLECTCLLRCPLLFRMHLNAGALPVQGFPNLIRLATEPALPNRPTVPEFIKVVREAQQPWSPARHHLFSFAFQHRAIILLIVRARLSQMTALPILPVEIWLHIISFLTRSYF